MTTAFLPNLKETGILDELSHSEGIKRLENTEILSVKIQETVVLIIQCRLAVSCQPAIIHLRIQTTKGNCISTSRKRNEQQFFYSEM